MKSSSDLNWSFKPSDKSSIGKDNFDSDDVKDFVQTVLQDKTYVKASDYAFKIPNDPDSSKEEYENFIKNACRNHIISKNNKTNQIWIN